MTDKRFNVRVYGLLINEAHEVLVSDECQSGKFFTKFPGGGLEWGEGLPDGLKREFMEELGIEITVGNLYYCTDFFVESAWRKNDQLISIYYLVDYPGKNELNFAEYTRPFWEPGEQFRWIPMDELSETIFTFPIDKHVAGLLNPSGIILQEG